MDIGFQTHTSQPQRDDLLHEWTKYVIVAVLLLFVSIGGFIYILKRQRDLSVPKENGMNVSTEQQTQISPIMKDRSGQLVMSVEKSTVQVNQPVMVTIKGTSNGKDIVGFDILVNYDSQYLDNPVITSATPDFQVTSYTKKKGFISITGTKTAINQTKELLNKTALVSIKFVTLKKGQTSIQLNEKVNQEETKLVDINLDHIYPEGSSLSLELL
jgi:hypothetical protein